MKPHPLSPIHLVLPGSANDLLENFPGATDAVLNIVLHPLEPGLGKRPADRRGISEVERFGLLDSDPEEHHRLWIAVLQDRQKSLFEVETGIVVEIKEDEKTVGHGIESAAVRSQLRRQLVEEPFAPGMRPGLSLHGQATLAPMRDDFQDMLRKKSGKPRPQEGVLGSPLDKNVQDQFGKRSSK
ncbi:MAG TPA: hypothetical protein VF789_24775 [Thermoanaerobaculia bacterium]